MHDKHKGYVYCKEVKLNKLVYHNDSDRLDLYWCSPIQTVLRLISAKRREFGSCSPGQQDRAG